MASTRTTLFRHRSLDRQCELGSSQASLYRSRKNVVQVRGFYCRPGGFKPFKPVLVLLFRRASSENRGFRTSSAPPATPPASGISAFAAGDVALAARISAFLLGWKIRLYIASGLLGRLAGRAGGAAWIELVVDWAGEAGVMANVAACVRIGELGRGEGEAEKLKALEAMDGVTGWDMLP